MKDTTFKGRMISHTGEFMAALLLLQPMLDVLSYFMQNVGGTVFTTALRMALLLSLIHIFPSASLSAINK